MPIDSKRYPKNWSSLALAVKEAAGWKCQCCGKRCYKPGERPENLTRSQWMANILQVHHRDYDPSNNSLSNLQPLCSACHLNVHKSQYRSISEGQLSLF